MAADVPRGQRNSWCDQSRGNGEHRRRGQEREVRKKGRTAQDFERHHQKIFLDLNCLGKEGKEGLPRRCWEFVTDPPARLGQGQSPRR